MKMYDYAITTKQSRREYYVKMGCTVIGQILTYSCVTLSLQSVLLISVHANTVHNN